MDAAIPQETVDYIAIGRLQSAYADIVTRRAWRELETIFLPDIVVTIDRRSAEPIELRGPGAVGQFIATSIERFDFFEFVILNTVVAIDGDTATARLWMCELRHDEQHGQWSNAFGLYQDRYARGEEGWRFAGRSYHSLARTARELDVFPFPPTGQLGPGGVPQRSA
jgi:hypothetical protein